MHDVAVIGGGVVGAAVARLLSTFTLDVALVEARRDIGAGTSKANTAILHTGFDATPGTVESRLVARGYELLGDYARRRGIAVEETGALLVAWDADQAAALPGLAAKAAANGYARSSLVDPAEVYALEPHLGPGVLGGLLVPDEHIIDPWSPPLAFAREAQENGVSIVLGHRIDTVQIGTEWTALNSAQGVVRARYVVNAAGLYGDEIHRRFGFDGFTVRPRRGELIVFDKLARPLVTRTILPVPTATTKGVLIAPTVFGNLMLGPTAEDLDDKAATGSSTAGIAGLLDKGRRILPGLLGEEVTAVYAGLRAATEHADYQLSADAGARYVCLGGIRSTGLTASMALAEEAAALLAGIGLTLRRREDLPDPPRATQLGEAFPRPYETGGVPTCFCERVTAEEIDAACRGPLPATDLDGIRRRTRATAGRCQGFHCLAEVTAIATAASGRPAASWTALDLGEPS